MSKRKLQSMAWWLEGEEECPHCHQLYAYELEIRCPECDEPSCPHCVRLHVEICQVTEEAPRG
jgi:hypothetical protein